MKLINELQCEGVTKTTLQRQRGTAKPMLDVLVTFLCL